MSIEEGKRGGDLQGAISPFILENNFPNIFQKMKKNLFHPPPYFWKYLIFLRTSATLFANFQVSPFIQNKK